MGVGATAEDDHLKEAAAGTVGGEEEGVLALEDEHLGLFVRADGNDVIFLDVPSVVEFIGKFIDEMIPNGRHEDGVPVLELQRGIAVAAHRNQIGAEVVDAHLANGQLARVVIDDIGAEGATISRC